MSVLLVNTCADRLSELEFVAPIARIVRDALSAGGDGAEAEGGGIGGADGAATKGADSVRVESYLRVDRDVVAEASHVIVCGTALQDDGYLKHPDRFAWLRETERPVLAICSGMQALALQFDARLVECTEIGMVTVETVAGNPLCAGTFEAYALHRHAVEGPAAFEVLARSAAAAQVVRHRQRPFYGVLFHPEVRHAAVVREFLAL